ncbi:MAG: DUF3418 domain-containing protein [Opitutaceae bacterium]|nr:DUF3418 domain-containing protein [Opitutaceae bacterium]
MPSRVKKAWPFRIEYPPELPISLRADEIVMALQQHQVLVLAGETGSGKTTQIPKMCLAAGRGERGRIACTQPRRVAATSVSRRVAEEMGVTWGREVGCKIRFADQTSRETVIKFLTDGMLLAELQGDPFLGEYDTIIVDEAHERSLNIDFLLGHLRRLRQRRPDLKIIITSATIDTEAFAKAFGGAPIIEVSGRLYPVEVIYAPIGGTDDAETDDAGPGSESPAATTAPSGKPQGRRGPTAAPGGKGRPDDYTYIDATVEAAERVLKESDQGDVLIFLPTGRDIREVCDSLDGWTKAKARHFKTKVDLVPLYGRLTNAEQQRVFAPSPHRKVVVATNIAETSLTIPGIRFVIDTGLARISRYAPQSRTRRLPVEAVAQSSADQRKGRCGRVSDGVCIRLYAEADYLNRPRYTQPEIQRSNLADVILRMKAFGLGEIEDFPFLNAPPAKGIHAGYALLRELSATDEAGGLTELGRELAHLPVDPTVGRMILQARREHALREVLIIAAGLSIQDPRERPLDARAKADTAHRRFTHPDSDFLTLLAIWEAYHDEFERMTLGKLRHFCTAHYLSFTRMREWRDIHAQLVEVLEGRQGYAMSSIHDGARKGLRVDLQFGTPAYRAIHRSILAGLLGNVATRADDGTYLATHDRKVAVFPGSALFERPEIKKMQPSGPAPHAKGRVARWLMAAEIMETGRVYARTCGRIDPRWAIELGAHLLRIAHSEPFWSVESGRVLVKERRRLYNLELDLRAVGYGRINPAHATEIFIREALVNETITWPFDFLAHNRRMREKTEAILTRTRSSGYMNLDEIAYRFYAARLLVEGGDHREAGSGKPEGAPAASVSGAGPATGTGHCGISSVPELVDYVRTRQRTEPRFLFMSEEDLQPPADTAPDSAAYPNALPLENRVLPLTYAYRPGREEDGVTLRVGMEAAESLTPAALDWAVPGHLREKIEIMLKALPKELRRTLIPLTETAQNLAAQLPLLGARPRPPTLAEALAELLSARFDTRIDPALWADKPLPDHLRVRVEVVDKSGRIIAASRDLATVNAALRLTKREVSQKAERQESQAWRDARARWETAASAEWKFGDLPEQIVVSEHQGVPVLAYPGLQATAAGVAVRLFAKAEEAETTSRGGLAQLMEEQLRYEIGWLERDLRALRGLGPLAVTLVPVAAMQQQALASIVRWLCAREVKPLQAALFTARVQEARHDLRGLVPRLRDWLQEIFTLRLALQTHPQPYPGMADDLAALLPPDFLQRMQFPRIRHLARYLRAMQARADRWRRDPAKDGARAAQVAPYLAAVRKLGDRTGEFRWLIEEFRVSLFAQELGTAEPVSAVRLDRALAELGGLPAAGPERLKESRDKPAPAILVTPKGKRVLKSFGALGALPTGE